MNRQEDRDAYTQLGRSLNERHIDQLSTQLSVFQSAVINFANEHGDEIKSNGEFRNKFAQISQSIGIDPLELLLYTSKNKRENFYVGLVVRIIEICQSTRDLNGGLISLKELISIVKDTHTVHIDINQNDIEQSLSMLNTLGNGYEILTINDKKWLKYTSAIGDNLSIDQKKVYELCGFMGGYVTISNNSLLIPTLF
ncbi:dot2 [[Candida] subhashii]|uniref:Dot2 n=1 Tax=[Candida] subhashii TaxID=561895 RepID=A0A8J5UIE2_9ASCO|nr:dot2 [[Candida] subhashii]KAG7663558.1 dot2 [[Candida] subhashii]